MAGFLFGWNGLPCGDMKRVLIFSLTYHPYIGGAEVAIKEITDRIDPGEYSFDMVTLRFDSKLPEVEKFGNVTVHRIGCTVPGVKVSDRNMPFKIRMAKILFPVTAFWKAMQLHRTERFDMTWAMMANQSSFAALLFKMVHPRVPYYLELQDGNSLVQLKKRQPILRVLWPIYMQVYRRANIVKAISHCIEKLAREAGYAGPLVVIPNGVDVKKFSAPIAEDALVEAKEKYGKHMGDVFLFTASRLVLSRGVEDVIRALAHLPGNVKFLIAGDGEDRAKLEAIANDVGVRERVVFAGQVNHVELPLLLRISDVFVRPSIIEGMGNAFIEAFAAGVPVVATPVGGIPDFLFDPEANPDMEPTGLFCKVRDPQSIALAVSRYMRDAALTARVVKNAQELAARRYEWDLIARDMQERIFKRV